MSNRHDDFIAGKAEALVAILQLLIVKQPDRARLDQSLKSIEQGIVSLRSNGIAGHKVNQAFLEGLEDVLQRARSVLNEPRAGGRGQDPNLVVLVDEPGPGRGHYKAS